MLDHLSDTDSQVQPKLTTQSRDVEGSTRHLTQADLEAYMAGRFASARLQQCQSHLDSCEACRAELEDLRTFKSDWSGLPRPEAQRFELGRRKRRPGLTLPLAAAVAIIFVAAISAVLWWEHARPRPNRNSVAVTAASHSPVPPPLVATTQPRDTRPAAEIAAVPADVRLAVSESTQHGKSQLPTEVSRSRGQAPTSSGTSASATSATNTGFALLGPLGEAVETRPEFRWQPLAGAVRYSVAIVDERLHLAQHSPALQTTSWRPRLPLRRGQTYLWQVTATLPDRSNVVASGPSPQGALLRIVPSKLADEIAQFRQRHAEAHLVLGALYAEAGMLTESADELRKVPPGDRSYSAARALLESLPSMGSGDPLPR